MDNFGYWSRGKERLLLLILIALAVFLYAGFSYGLPWRFNSPDEAANAFFSQRVAQGQKLAAPAELNEITVNPIVHPRSTQLVQGKLAPASFLGLPLIVGTIGRVLGQGILPYITPLLAALGLGCFFFIVRGLSGQRPAVLATVLLAMTPAFWYYHSRSFFHNALFFDFLLLAVCLLFQAVKTKKAWVYLVAGLALGLTLSLRTSEIFWMTAAGLVWLGLNWRQVKWRYLWLLILGVLISFSPVLVTNYHIYGSVLSVGYRQDLLLAGDLKQAMGLLSQLVLPFGFHPRVILATVTNYLVELTWWWTVLAGAGIVYLLAIWRRLSRPAKSFAVALLVVCGWLVVVYGSWQFNDNPDPSATTLGTSYVRYWLPIYGFLLWPASLALARLTERKWGKEFILALVGCYAVLSALLVWWEPAEGLAQVRANVQRFEVWAGEGRALTEADSVIVTGMTDKLFWPERKVIYDLVNPADYEAVGKLLAWGTPVYWFHPTWFQDDFNYVNQRLSAFGLELTPRQYGWQDFSLYKFVPVP